MCRHVFKHRVISLHHEVASQKRKCHTALFQNSFPLSAAPQRAIGAAHSCDRWSAAGTARTAPQLPEKRPQPFDFGSKIGAKVLCSLYCNPIKPGRTAYFCWVLLSWTTPNTKNLKFPVRISPKGVPSLDTPSKRAPFLVFVQRHHPKV